MVSNLIDTYSSTLAVVEYHYTDDFATPWGDSRANFYGVEILPFLGYDGGPDACPIETYESKFLARQAVPTNITIQLYGELVSNQTYEISATVCRESGGSGSTPMRIYMVEVLDALWDTLPSYSRNTFRQAAASTTNISLTPGQCVEVVKNFTFDSTISWPRKESIKIVAWAQTPSASGPAEVFQAAWMGWPFPAPPPPPGDIDGDGDVDMTDLALFIDVLVGSETDPTYVGRCDLNRDSVVNGLDIQSFIEAML